MKIPNFLALWQLAAQWIFYMILCQAQGPQNHIFVLGYAGWGAGQLEEEYQEDSWMLLPYHSELIFSDPQRAKMAKCVFYPWHRPVSARG